jgi:uncharacterized protein YdaU (DUF1376 family)
MAIQKPEWFKIDAAKFLSDARVDALTTLELGACLRLLCRQWLDGFVPDDLRLLGRLCRLDEQSMGEAWVTLADFFPVVAPGKRANRFMWIEREKVIEDLERRSDEGTRNARKRWDETRKQPNATPNGLPMRHPMQDQTRADQTRADQQPNATPNGLPMLSESLQNDRGDRVNGLNPTEVSRALCLENGWSGTQMLWVMQDAVEFQAKKMPEASLKLVGEWLVKAYREHQSAQGKFAVGVQKFFAEGRYQSSTQSSDAGDYFKERIFTDNPATRALAQMETD